MVYKDVQRRRRAASWVCARAAALLAMASVLAGCPEAQLSVSPSVVNFGLTAERASFTIANPGRGTVEWTLSEVVLRNPVDPSEGWIEEDIPWLTVDAGNVSGETATETDRVFLNVTRAGLAAGQYGGVGIRVTSNAGTVVVGVVMTVSGGGEGEGEGEPSSSNLVVAPTELTIRGLRATASFTVTNEGTLTARWSLEIKIVGENLPSNLPIQIAADVGLRENVTAPAKETKVTLGIPEPDSFDTNYVTYQVTIRDLVSRRAVAEIAVYIEVAGAPLVEAFPAILDFGTELYQVSFRVANVGDIYSLLNFDFFTLAEGAKDTYVPFDVAGDPLVAVIATPEGMADVNAEESTDPDLWVNARPVTVTISREGLTKDLEYRTFYIGAVSGVDNDGNPIMDTTVPPKKVEIRVLSVATVEGAIPRSRPPSLTRFVFSLRDRSGQIVATEQPRVREEISFRILENNIPLVLDETNFFTEGPQGLKYKIVILLDFSGSMYWAGTRDPVNRLAPGEAIDIMKQAAKQFIMDLPDSYQIALMEFHDVFYQPSPPPSLLTRTIHGFDTNREALVSVLDAFTVPEAEHGATQVFDAVGDAIAALVNEDALLTLPFDDADVRSVVFITDGWDTSSLRAAGDLTSLAQASRVRLVPIAYSGEATRPVNDADLIAMGAETGGHTYHAAVIGDLVKALDSEKTFSFGKATADLKTGRAVLQLRNTGDTAMSWNVLDAPENTAVTPSQGVIPPLQTNDSGAIIEPGIRDLTIQLPTLLPSDTFTGTIALSSDAGNARVNLKASTFEDGDLGQFSVLPHTEEAGTVWRELRNQIVLTYVSPSQSGSISCSIETTFPDSEGKPTSASFQKNCELYTGDVRAGQISLTTTGIQNGQAEIFVRADYVPRNITQFRFRFIPEVPVEFTPLLTDQQRAGLLAKLKADIAGGAVQVVSDGLLDGWRSLPDDGIGVFYMVTEPDNFVRFGAFGNLMRLRFEGLGPNDVFVIKFRVDNTLYYSPATDTAPSMTKYFLYPGGYSNPDGRLKVSKQSSYVAGPGQTVEDMRIPFYPEAPNAWDRDEDSWNDFDDSYPDDDELGDDDADQTPDLDDPEPDNPGVPGN